MPETAFKDLFSASAKEYALYRPTYPPELFAWLAAQVKSHDAAWDCATGNGQAAVALAPFFQRILATDASEEQLSAAAPNPRITYSKGSAEASGLADQSVTLVTVAQAFHWFKHAAFFAEVRRVAKPGESVLAVWMYNLPRVGAAVDAVIDRYYAEVIGRYWEPERKLVDKGYATIAVPFPALSLPAFHMQADWPLSRLVGYMGTWSATLSARKALGRDPVEEIAADLVAAWGGDASRERTLRWPLTVRAFSI